MSCSIKAGLISRGGGINKRLFTANSSRGDEIKMITPMSKPSLVSLSAFSNAGMATFWVRLAAAIPFSERPCFKSRAQHQRNPVSAITALRLANAALTSPLRRLPENKGMEIPAVNAESPVSSKRLMPAPA